LRALFAHLWRVGVRALLSRSRRRSTTSSPPRLHSRVVSQGNNKRAQRTGWCLGSTSSL
jgi:hypothetical protein